MAKYALLICLPKLCEWTGMRLIKKNCYFENLTKHAMQHRREQGSEHNDMLGLFINLIDKADKKSRATKESSRPEADNNGINDEQFEEDARLNGVTKEAVVDEETITQSATLFLTVGNDTTSNALSIVTYYLAINPEVQERVRQEIDDIAATVQDGKVTYEEIKR